MTSRCWTTATHMGDQEIELPGGPPTQAGMIMIGDPPAATPGPVMMHWVAAGGFTGAGVFLPLAGGAMDPGAAVAFAPDQPDDLVIDAGGGLIDNALIDEGTF